MNGRCAENRLGWVKGDSFCPHADDDGVLFYQVGIIQVDVRPGGDGKLAAIRRPAQVVDQVVGRELDGRGVFGGVRC